MPELSFHLDDSIERGAEVIRLIEQVASSDRENEDEH
jgi:ribosome-binding factor A